MHACVHPKIDVRARGVVTELAPPRRAEDSALALTQHAGRDARGKARKKKAENLKS